MIVYIEYAIIQNFLFDGALLTLALAASKCVCKIRRILFSASIGALFAVLFPLLILPTVLKTLLKISVGVLLCLLAYGPIKTKTQRANFLLTTLLFFELTFFIGGGILGFIGGFFPTLSDENAFTVDGLPTLLTVALFSGFCLLSAFVIRRLYARKQRQEYIYRCRIKAGDKEIMTDGFLDSGNLAQKDGIPVCFLSPDVWFDLVGDSLIYQKDEGQVRDEMQIFTLAGSKTATLYLGEIEIKIGAKSCKKRVYFSPAKNMIGREYKLLIPAELGKVEDDERI